MHNPSSHHAMLSCNGCMWADWPQSGLSGPYQWSNSSLTTLGEGSSSRHSSRKGKDTARCSPIPVSYTLTPPTPSTTDSDTSSSSQLSMESIPEYDDMPEIPFVSAAIAYPKGWMADRPSEQIHSADCQPSSSFWSGIIGIRPSTSKSSVDSAMPVLGHTNERVFAASRTCRKRSGSVSSITSSRTRPAPAKSILSSSSSVKTSRRKAPSVKFLEMPTVHYEDDDYLNDYDNTREPSSCISPPPPKKAKGLSGLFSFKWLFGPSSNSKSGPTKAAASGRPTISGPFPLWDSPPRARGAYGKGTSAASLRSMKSNGSLRSMRSCSSRLPMPTYWPR